MIATRSRPGGGPTALASVQGGGDGGLASAPSARAREPQRQQEHDRSDRGVNDEADDSETEMNSKAMQKPVADEGANDSNRRVTDETKPVAPYDLACQPSGNEPHDQNDYQSLIRQMHALSL
jgi:hypothetical protein